MAATPGVERKPGQQAERGRARYLVPLGAGALIAVSLALVYFFGGGQKFMAIATAPNKTMVISDSPKAREANEHFWNTLHSGSYEDIPRTIELLTIAFMENPNDPDLARRLAFAHAWRMVERNRLEAIPQNITDHAFLAELYYAESYKLNPDDHRMLGAVAIMRLLDGQLLKDEKMVREGYFLALEANRKWPEFNYFTTGTAMALLHYEDPKFKAALEWQAKTMEVCNSEQDFKDNLTMEEFQERYGNTAKRVCWDSWIAPHNMEGFLLHWGDMLVKSGDWRKGIEVYNKAKEVRYYESWPLKDFLEERIKNAEANVEYFRKDRLLSDKIDEPTMLLHSGYYCVSCHQTSGTVPALPGAAK